MKNDRLITIAFAVIVIIAALTFGCSRENDNSAGAPDNGQIKKPDVVHKPAPVAPLEIQQPIVAGTFYPSDPEELKADVNAYVGKAKKKELPGQVFGLMSPHAGYKYSGPIAGKVYKTIEGTSIKRFVILGPAHRVPFNGVFVMDKDRYHTPLGDVVIDNDAAKKMLAARPWITSDPDLYSAEHSLEVQIPFIQQIAGNDISVSIVMIGRISYQQCAQLAQVLYDVFPDDDVIFIASTDMSHGNYPPYKGTEQTKPVDLKTLELIKSMDIEAVEQGVQTGKGPMCGGLAVVTLMRLFELKGGEQVEILGYADSGDATGDHARVVGYGGAAFLLDNPIIKKEKKMEKENEYFLTDEEKIELLKIARASVEAAVKGEKTPPAKTSSATLKSEGAAFVTLKNTGQLRGCIGSIIAHEPLYKCVEQRAVDAAVHDSRFAFNPIKPSELSKIDIEISVLTPLVTCESPDDVVVGRDGIILTLSGHRGVFLPQVPVEQGWDHAAYLSNICRKAGVNDPMCWKDPEAKIERFEAIVFSEHEMGF